MRGLVFFNNSLVVGTANYVTSSDIAYEVPTRISKAAMSYLNGDVAFMKNFKSDGCEVWAYNENIGWKPIVGNDPEAIMQSGFGDCNNFEVGFLKEFKGKLYAGIRNQFEGCQVWRTNSLNDSWEQVASGGFGNINNTWCMTACVFNDELYVGTFNLKEGSEIFKTSDGKNWELIVGQKSDIKNGFNDKTNFYTWSMCVYNSYLYVGTNSYKGGGEVWRSTDGINWAPIIAHNSFFKAYVSGAIAPRGLAGDSVSYRGGIRTMMVYNGELYIGFVGEDLVMDFFLSLIHI